LPSPDWCRSPGVRKIESDLSVQTSEALTRKASFSFFVSMPADCPHEYRPYKVISAFLLDQPVEDKKLFGLNAPHFHTTLMIGPQKKQENMCLHAFLLGQ